MIPMTSEAMSTPKMEFNGICGGAAAAAAAAVPRALTRSNENRSIRSDEFGSR